LPDPATRGPTPLKNKRSPTRLAWGYDPTGFGAEDVEMLSLMARR